MAEETVGAALRRASAELAGISETPRLDAELLMAEALGTARSAMLLHATDRPAPARFAALLARRAGHEPVAYILGRQEFYGLDLAVTPEVLIPRVDSETLIDAAVDVFARRPPPARLLDLGTGSGALLLAALTVFPATRGWGIDRSPGAVAVASANAGRLGLARRATMLAADWCEPDWRAGLPATFDLILANPPYVADCAALDPQVRDFEPAGALFAGTDGLGAYSVLIPQLRQLLAPQGRVVLEIGCEQAGAVAALAIAEGFSAEVRPDLGQRDRAVVLTDSAWQGDA